ncbi:DUF3618 domain-containing protein [Kitasatospora sp. NPDC086009]|uniref:DUF3618 domain-containing protein n=1 Tax=unclassified Kitasatospora TaxID=2633591 RepID=UPI0037CACA50
MGATPDELRSEVEARRAHLARNVDRLADKVAPGRVAHRQAEAARDRITGIRERVMGTVHDTGSSAQRAAAATGEGVEHLGETAKETAAQIGDAVQQTPAQVRRRTQGSPLAAGLMAFGAGLLAAALLPTSKVEEQGGAKLREHPELLEPAKQAAVEAVQEVRDELREPAGDAVRAVKSTAQDAAQTSKGAAQDAGQRTAHDLKAAGQEAADEIRHQGQGGQG